jgi:hypothetical protein
MSLHDDVYKEARHDYYDDPPYDDEKEAVRRDEAMMIEKYENCPVCELHLPADVLAVSDAGLHTECPRCGEEI